MLPSTTSSMLGRVAAVMETESPSQLMPSEIQSMWTSSTPLAVLLVSVTSYFSFPLAPHNRQPLESTRFRTKRPLRVSSPGSRPSELSLFRDFSRRTPHPFERMACDPACSLNPGLAAIPIYPLKCSGGRITAPQPVVNLDKSYFSDAFEALPEPVTPLIDALAGPRAGEDAPDTGVDRIEVVEELLQVEVQMLE